MSTRQDKRCLVGILFLLAFAILAEQSEGASLKESRRLEQQQQLQQDGGIELEPFKQQQAANLLLRRQQQQQQQQPLLYADNGPEIAALVQQAARQRQLRRQRSVAPSQQQLSEEELVMKRQLSDLIAQVRDDKSVDQALLRLLILANLRSAPSSLVAHNQQQPAAYGPGSARLALDGGSQEALGPLVQRVPLEDLASIETLGGDLSQIYSQDQLFQNQMDKREYIKPCSFNAVSCAKNPFRKF